MKVKILGGLLIAALAVTSVAEAQTKTPVINARQHMQEKRINQGVRSGELTKREARTLRKDERKLTAEKRAYKATGHVTAAERRHMRHQENHISKAIYAKKHNGRVRRG